MAKIRKKKEKKLREPKENGSGSEGDFSGTEEKEYQQFKEVVDNGMASIGKEMSIGSTEASELFMKMQNDPNIKTEDVLDAVERIFSFQNIKEYNETLARNVQGKLEKMGYAKEFAATDLRSVTMEALEITEDDVKEFKPEKCNAKDVEEMEKMMRVLLYLVFKKGKTPREALEIDDGTMETMYAQAYSLYNGGKYDDAVLLFKFLGTLEPNVYRYKFGLAAAMHKKGEYEDAASYYFMASMMEDATPVAHYHSSDCYLKMNAPDSAIVALSFAMDMCGTDPKWKSLKIRAALMRKSIEKKLDRIPEDKRPVPDTPKSKMMKKITEALTP